MDFNFFKRKQPLGARQSQRSALAARLSDAEQAVAEAQRAATEAALEGRDDTALDRAETHIRATQARVITLNEAIAALDAEIEEAEEADQKQRAATAREINKLADAIENALPDIVTSLKRGHTAIEAGRFLFDGIGMYDLLTELENSLPSSFAILASEMRARAEQTVAGIAPIEVIPPAPPIPRTRVFALQNLKWHDPESRRLSTVERYDICELPSSLADLALSKNLAIDPEVDRARELIKLRRGCPPDPARCYDLDLGGEPPKPPAGIVPWDAFRHLDRGPAITAFMPGSPSFEPAAARSVSTTNNSDQNDGK